MKELEKIKDFLVHNLSPKRFIHSENTALTAEKMAIIYKADSKKAYLAGLVHDCTRDIDIKLQNNMVEALGIEPDELTLASKELLHAHTAEFIIKKEFDIHDKEILSAVKFHTTGRESMTLLEKIIFLSDAIEPGRFFHDVDIIRLHAFDDIDTALIAAFDSSIKFLLDKKQRMHPDTLLARNYVLKHFKE